MSPFYSLINMVLIVLSLAQGCASRFQFWPRLLKVLSAGTTYNKGLLIASSCLILQLWQ